MVLYQVKIRNLAIFLNKKLLIYYLAAFFRTKHRHPVRIKLIRQYRWFYTGSFVTAYVRVCHVKKQCTRFTGNG